MGATVPHLAEADRRVVALARDVKLLSALSWPSHLRDDFVAAWKAGQRRLPTPGPVRVGTLADLDELARLAVPVADHPAARFVAATAQSYVDAGRLLAAAGTARFTDIACEIYGRPSDPVAQGAKMRSIDAATELYASTQELLASAPEREEDYCVTPAAVRERLARPIDEFFGRGRVEVVIDPDIAAKAAAGASAVRIRGATAFSDADVDQLLQHEAFVHTATLLNGRAQPNLECLSLGAPRTTACQEGLATFAELITTSVDLARLSRIALRILAIDKALSGADFIEIFEFFVDAGQTLDESFQSTARIFRGGDPRGGSVFTKDTVYLRGLIDTYAFLHGALADRRVTIPRRMFVGRVTWPDLLALEPAFDEGLLLAPRFVPPWAEKLDRLAAFLAFSHLTRGLREAAMSISPYAAVAAESGPLAPVETVPPPR